MTQTQSPTKIWFIDKNQFTQNDRQDNKKIYLIKTNQIQTQEYRLNIPWFRYQKQQELFQWRFHSEFPIIKAYHASVLKQERNSVCVSVLIEKFKNTLCSVTSLSIVNAIYLLKISLTALQSLSKKFGFFKPMQNAIGITSKGDCKVWVNGDLTKNQVQQKCQNESQMVKILFSCVRNKIQGAYKNSQLFLKVEQQKFSFYAAQNLLTKFAYQEAIIFPICFDFLNKEFDSFDNLNLMKNSRKSLNSNRLSRSSFHGDLVPFEVKKSTLFNQTEHQNVNLNIKIASGVNFMTHIKKFRSQNCNNGFTAMHGSQNDNFLHIPNFITDMKRSSDKTNKSTQGSADITDLPQNIKQFEAFYQRPRLKKHRTYKLQAKDVFESSIMDDQNLKIESCFVRKRSPTRNNQNNCVTAVSNCWSQTDIKEKEFTQENFQKNNWQMKINNLLEERNTDLKSSVHVTDTFDSRRQDKIDELNRLKLNRFSGSEQIYESICQDSPKGNKKFEFPNF